MINIEKLNEWNKDKGKDNWVNIYTYDLQYDAIYWHESYSQTRIHTNLQWKSNDMQNFTMVIQMYKYHTA